jgi:hypothetical protein
VVYAFAALSYEFRDRGIRPGRFQQLDTAFACVQHGHPYALIVNLIEPGHLQADPVLVNFNGFGQRFDGDADVVDLHFSL